MKKFLLRTAKSASFLVCFALLFGVFQRILIPKYTFGSTTATAITDGFYKLERNSLDILFLGPSQMYCTVNAGKMSEDLGLEAYDLGASSQQNLTTVYYLKEALKTQAPKLIMVELCTVYWGKFIDEQNLAWNYTANHLSREKAESIYELSDEDLSTTVMYSFPLLQFHSRWGELNSNDIHYDYDASLRGYAPLDKAMPVDMVYPSDAETDVPDIPEENQQAIRQIAEICSENDIELVFFKTPLSTWTKNESAGIKRFMSDNNLVFLDMNDYLDEIGIDGETDFCNESHLNISGAEKSTDFLEAYIRNNFASRLGLNI